MLDRETSWLRFGGRVLQEAADPSVPLVERLKFIGIFSSNLEEFFRVRVATLQRMVEAGIDSNKLVYGGSPKKILKQIHEAVVERPADLASGAITREVTRLLLGYLTGAPAVSSRARPGRRRSAARAVRRQPSRYRHRRT